MNEPNMLPNAMQPVLVIRELQPDGSIDEARLYLDAWVGLFTNDCCIGGYHCVPAPVELI